MYPIVHVVYNTIRLAWNNLKFWLLFIENTHIETYANPHVYISNCVFL